MIKAGLVKWDLERSQGSQKQAMEVAEKDGSREQGQATINVFVEGTWNPQRVCIGREYLDMKDDEGPHYAWCPMPF